MSTSRYNTAASAGIESLRGVISAVGASLESHLRFVGFWTAVLTPFVLLALLATGVATQQPLLWGGLVVTNAAGLVLGRDHGQ
jgi:hypothetical protein